MVLKTLAVFIIASVPCVIRILSAIVPSQAFFINCLSSLVISRLSFAKRRSISYSKFNLTLFSLSSLTACLPNEKFSVPFSSEYILSIVPPAVKTFILKFFYTHLRSLATLFHSWRFNLLGYSRSLGTSRFEALHAPGSIDDLLVTRKEWVASRANFYFYLFLRPSHSESIPA